jgi:hypothetical protein
MSKFKFKNDFFKKSRGGTSRLLEIRCAHCSTVVCQYQKDGPGILKRMYVDRIISSEDFSSKENLVCNHCQRVLGSKYIYEKEGRLAFRLFIGAVSKSLIKQ